MKRISFRGVELTISLLKTLSQAVDVRSRLVMPEILGNDRSLFLRFGPVDEGRLRPVLIPIGRQRRAWQGARQPASTVCGVYPGP